MELIENIRSTRIGKLPCLLPMFYQTSGGENPGMLWSVLCGTKSKNAIYVTLPCLDDKKYVWLSYSGQGCFGHNEDLRIDQS